MARARIAAKRKEIEDASSFFGQVGDFAEGLVGIGGKVPEKPLSSGGEAYETAFAGEEMTKSGFLGLGQGASCCKTEPAPSGPASSRCDPRTVPLKRAGETPGEGFRWREGSNLWTLK